MKTVKHEKIPTFIADCHLGKVAKYLRMMGYDTLYFTHIDDDDLIKMANRQERTILTRDRELFARKKASCLLISEKETKAQLQEIIRFFHLTNQRHHHRCIKCNTLLQNITKNEVIDRVPEKVAHFFDEYEYCPTCDRIYWHGDHYRHMQTFIASLFP